MSEEPTPTAPFRRKYSLSTTCPVCKKDYIPDLLLIDPKQFLDAYTKWKGGMLIQNAFPASQSVQREQLMTSICSDNCWDHMFEVSQEVLRDGS